MHCIPAKILRQQFSDRRFMHCINNKEKLSEIGRKAREVYDNYFSLDMFEKNMLDAIRDSFSKRDRIVGS